MRDVLFRAWDTDNKEMFEPSIPYGDSVYKLVVIDIEKDRSYLAKIENAILMQYTGLLDKNGKRIFEDDICKFRDYEIGTIEFYEGSYWFLSETFSSLYSWELEVIGNIHEGVKE